MPLFVSLQLPNLRLFYCFYVVSSSWSPKQLSQCSRVHSKLLLIGYQAWHSTHYDTGFKRDCIHWTQYCCWRALERWCIGCACVSPLSTFGLNFVPMSLKLTKSGMPCTRVSSLNSWSKLFWWLVAAWAVIWYFYVPLIRLIYDWQIFVLGDELWKIFTLLYRFESFQKLLLIVHHGKWIKLSIDSQSEITNNLHVYAKFLTSIKIFIWAYFSVCAGGQECPQCTSQHFAHKVSLEYVIHNFPSS